MNSLQKIEEAVYAIRPELKELSFGYKVKNNKGNQGVVLWKTGRPEGSVMIFWQDELGSMPFQWI